MSLSEVLPYLFRFALMQKNATQISGRISFHLLHFFAAHVRISIPLFKNSVNSFFDGRSKAPSIYTLGFGCYRRRTRCKVV